MVYRMLAMAAVLVVWATVARSAPTLEELQKENEALRGENKQMRADLDSMKQRMDEFQKALDEKVDKARYQQECAAMLKEIQASQPSTEQWVSTVAAGTKLKIYGFVRADMVVDSRRTAGGYFSGYVLRNDATGKANETNITARNSRIGFDLTFPKYADIETSAKIEMDWGTAETTGTAELSPTPRMRLAYLQAKTSWATFVAGQAWDVFSPLIPFTDDVDDMWLEGNVGYRHPQFRVEREWKLAPAHKLLTQFALVRAVGGNAFPATSDNLDDGSASGWPDLQGRLAYATRLLTQSDSTFGVSGVFGERDTVAIVDKQRFDDDYQMWGVNLDATVPLLDKLPSFNYKNEGALAFRGEYWNGTGLASYYGNIGQFYNETLRRPYSGQGGWGELDYQVTKDLVFRGGWGLDCVDTDTLSKGNRENNTDTFFNFSYNITPNLVWTVEYEFIRTSYFEVSDGQVADNHVSTSIALKF